MTSSPRPPDDGALPDRAPPSDTGRGIELPYAAGERLPWLLRGGRPAEPPPAAEREGDRAAAASARRQAMLALPALAVAWLLAVTLGGDAGIRVGSLVALVVAAYVGARAAVTTQRFRRRWVDDADRHAPPAWVTLVTVAAVVTAFVAVASTVADLQAGRPALVAALWTGAAVAVVGVGAYAHLAGGRSVAAALREPGDPSDPPAGSG